MQMCDSWLQWLAAFCENEIRLKLREHYAHWNGIWIWCMTNSENIRQAAAWKCVIRL